MTTKVTPGSLDNALMSVGGRTRKVERYYRRIVRIRGVIHEIRGRFELLISSPQERDRIQERLHSTYRDQVTDARRLTEEELAAIALLEADPSNWKDLGGIMIFMQPSEENVPDYPPNQSVEDAKVAQKNPANPPVQAPHVKEHTEDAIADMQSEGGPA